MQFWVTWLVLGDSAFKGVEISVTVMSSAAQPAASNSLTPGSPLTTPPLFIFGCPRSGTTFLGELLNKHDQVLITNEIRMMTFLTDVFNRSAQNRHLLHNPDYRDKFVAHAKAGAGSLIRTFYEKVAKESGKRVTVWGDKTPGYADPILSRGCLEFTHDVFPDARWIHIRRDPRAVVHSLVAKKWHTLPSAVDIWARITRAGREFGATLPPHQYLEITHEAVLDDVEGVTRQLLDFLSLEMTPDVSAFVESEKVERRPVSDPVNLASGAAGQQGESLRHGLNDEQLSQVISLLGDRFDDVQAMLDHYAATDAGKATAQAIAAGVTGVANENAAGSSTTERTPAPGGFSGFTPVDQATLLGELESRLTGISVRVNGENVVPSASATVHAGDQVDIAMRVLTLKSFQHLVAGFSILDRTGQVLGGGNNALSGLGTLAAAPGPHTLLLSFRWPELGDAPFTLTLGIGEGKGNASDGESNHVQCWAPEAIVLRQRPRTLAPGASVAISLTHASFQAE